jgi:hypothetical protein
MRHTAALALLLLPALALANPFPKGDPKIGEKLAKEKNCESCHIKMLGGDGSGIYTRKDRLINTPQALLQRVSACSAQTNAGWFPEDEMNVAAYLNEKFYKFK